MQFKTKSKSDSNIIRLKDGDSITGVFRGEPVEYNQHYVGGDYIECTRGECCAGGKSQFRFRLNICKSNDAGVVEAQIFENGWKMYEQLEALQQSGYKLGKPCFVCLVRVPP